MLSMVEEVGVCNGGKLGVRKFVTESGRSNGLDLCTHRRCVSSFSRM